MKPDVYAGAGEPQRPRAVEDEPTDGMRTKLRSLLDRARGTGPPPPTADAANPRVHADPRRSRGAPRGTSDHHEAADTFFPRYEDARHHYHHRQEERDLYADHHTSRRHEDARYSYYYENRDPHYRSHEDVNYSHSDPRGRANEAYVPYSSHRQDAHDDRSMHENYDDRGPYRDRRDDHTRPHPSTPRGRYDDYYPHQDAEVGRGLLPIPGPTCTCPTHGASQWPSSVPAVPPTVYQSEGVDSILGDGHDAVIYMDHRSSASAPGPHHHQPHSHHSTPQPILVPPGAHFTSSSTARATGSPEGRHPPYEVDYRDTQLPTHNYDRRSTYDDEAEDENENNVDAHRHATMRITVANDADPADDLRALLAPKTNGHALNKSAKRSTPSSPTASAHGIITPHPNSKRRAKATTPAALPAPPPSKTAATLAEYEDDELFSDFAHMTHVLIPANASAALLERRGAFIQAISQQSRCTLSIRDRFEDVQGDADELRDELADMRLLRMYGRPSGVCLALRLAIERIREFRAQKRDPYYAPMTSELMVPLPDASVTRATVQWMGNRGVSTDAAEAEEDALKLVPVSNDDDAAVQLRWLVPTDHVGRMMGPKGTILAGIRRDTGAAIHVAETAEMGPGASERAVVIEGARESVLAAHSAIQARAGGRAEPKSGSASKMGQYFAIPYHTAGFLIGLRGGRARAITAKTGARLQIPSQLGLPLGSVNRIVHVQGTRKQIEHAVRVMSAKLRDYLAGDADLDDVGAGAEEKTRRQDEYDGEGDEEDDNEDVVNNEDEDPVTIRALVTTRAAAKLLDTRGRLVREIMRKSGAYLRFLKGAPRGRNVNAGDKSRVCLLSGDMSRVLRALRLLLQVEASDAQIKPKSSARNVPRVGKRKRVDDEQEQEAVDRREQEEQTPLDENHELPTKRSRLGRAPTASANTRPIPRLTPNAVRRPNGNAVKQRGVRGGGRGRKVQVVGVGSRSRRPVLAVRKS